MKPCFYCGGRKQKFKRDSELRITVICEKCGKQIKANTFDEAYAKGCWNTKMAELERNSKLSKEQAAVL